MRADSSELRADSLKCYPPAMAAEHSSKSAPLDPRPTLYLVATPIGNLEDITLRALRVLKGVDLIACEDTRQTQKLLNHYGITTKTVSYHEHNEMTKAAELVVDLEGGARIALVTDAGVPGISDPGFRLITLAIRHGVPVVPIPGASAFLAALVASGLPTDSFRFSGFLPSKRGERRTLFEGLRASARTAVFYEAPHRLLESLQDVVEVLGTERHIVVAREITKIHEEFLRGKAGEVLATLKSRGDVKGEITLLIAKRDDAAQSAVFPQVSIRDRMQQLMAEEKLDEKAALKKVAKEMGVSKSEAYREWQRTK
jgi:16S rRNA (cytidine1402-2'-O)-methyltransferase